MAAEDDRKRLAELEDSVHRVVCGCVKAVAMVTVLVPGVVASMHATAHASHATTASKMKQEGPEGW